MLQVTWQVFANQRRVDVYNEKYCVIGIYGFTMHKTSTLNWSINA